MKKLCTLFFAVLITAPLFSQNITLEAFADEFDDPIELKNAGDDRLFVVEQAGIIKILNTDGTTNTTPFLNISSIISSGGESGLLGLAFHPDYANNGYFYVNYTNLSGNNQISRYSVSTADPDVADSTSELPIIGFTQPFSNHNGGCLQFGPDGFLYIASGDGGSGGDPGNRAQNTSLLLGKLLRIDVDNPGGGNNYGIPADNPFVGSTSQAQEIWAYGLRNPWKFSFDSANGDVWIADVGQGAWEEVNKAGATEAGLNYGWRCYEGNAVFNTTGCPAPSTLTFPIAEYSHSIGFSITGGYVYRGTLYPNIEGYYFYADFGTGLIGTVSPTGVQNNINTFGGSWSAFGEDTTGQLYIVSYGGNIFKIKGELLGTTDFEAISVNLAPNPAKDSVSIQLAQGTLKGVSILDVKGSVVFEQNNTNTLSTEIDTSSLAKGMYLVRITSESGNAIQKLIIE